MSKLLYSYLILLLGFALPLNPVGNWYQQFMPSIGSRSIQDIFFLDSLTGWGVTNKTNQNPDTAFVLKTINGGDSWSIHYRKLYNGGGFPGLNKVFFLNQNTGFMCGVTGFDKTTDGGGNWTPLITTESFQDMSILSVDTIWLVSANSLTGGVFRTTNGGGNWEQQLNIGSQNPNHIYMVNGRIGFIAEDFNYLRKTTNSGVNWNVIPSENGFLDMHFIDTLTGWKAYGSIKKTTDGGNNWITQTLPSGGQLITSGISKFTVLNKDTLWGVGGQIFYGGSETRGIIFRTINGGDNWLFQAPDTAYGNFNYYSIQFVDKFHGWAYSTFKGVHTTTGGDINWITGIEQISTEIPKEFKLFQNFPNPFNPKTNIKYIIMPNVKGQMSNVKLTVYDITGKEIIILVSQRQNAGTYEVDFSGNGYSSGVYFYQLTVSNGKEVFTQTKKMLMVK